MLFVLISACAWAFPREYGDSAVYQGINVKLDLGNTAYGLFTSKGAVQQYEGLINVNLLKKYYPTMELGYMLASGEAAGGQYKGQGGFTRLGLDLNPLRKGRNNDYMLTVGMRVGMAVQGFRQWDITLHDPYWGTLPYEYEKKGRFDAWGEVVAGLQVKVVSRLHMGWALRIKFLFTETTGEMQPYYIPGFGCRESNGFSFNYYIGWRF